MYIHTDMEGFLLLFIFVVGTLKIHHIKYSGTVGFLL